MISELIDKKLLKLYPELKKNQKAWNKFKKDYDKITTEKGRMACDFGLAQLQGNLHEVNRVINVLEDLKRELK